MRNEMLQRKWNQVRSAATTWWAESAPHDVEPALAPEEKLIRFLQDRYGCALDEARAEVDRRLAAYDAKRLQ